MIYNILWGFSIDPPYFGYNSTEYENPILRIFAFLGPSWTQVDKGFFRALIFYHEKHLEEKESMRRGLEAKQV
jgi:hypothetical protein